MAGKKKRELDDDPQLENGPTAMKKLRAAEDESLGKMSEAECELSSGVAAEPARLHLVDNSVLKHKGDGIRYRLSKDPEDKDEPPAAMWGTYVLGVDLGDGWLKVGHRFLPMFVKGKPVLVCREQVFLVDNSILKHRGDGIRYRWSKDPEDKDEPPPARWGEYVKGVDEGDGWVRVGNRYLPTDVKGKRVLRPEGEPTPVRSTAPKGSGIAPRKSSTAEKASRRGTAGQSKAGSMLKGPTPTLENNLGTRYGSDDEDSSDDENKLLRALPLAPGQIGTAALTPAVACVEDTVVKITAEADSSEDEHVALDGAHLGVSAVKSEQSVTVVKAARQTPEGNAVRTLAKYALELLAKARAHRDRIARW